MLPTYHQLAFPHQPSQVVDELLSLVHAVFPDIQQQDTRWRLLQMPSCMAFCARVETQLVGFKIGYATKSNHYYSWLGGVHPDWLRRGIARELMQQQHAWLPSAGFKTVETGAQAANQAMCALNRASGFVEVGWRDKPRGRQLLFEKHL